VKILNKINNTKLIINIVVLILIYFFSFHIFPKLGFYNKLDFIGIKTNARAIFFQTQYKSDEIYLERQNNFLKQYFYYLDNNKNLISNAPCPRELLVNNLRNIQIYNDNILNVLDNDLKFNVRFSFYKFFGSSEKLDISKCFDYIFKENLNKYFILYRVKLIENLEFSVKYLKKMKIKNEIIVTEIKLNEHAIETIKSYNFFIDPNLNYSPIQQNDKIASKILTFILCLLIVVFINIFFNKLYRKQISRFIKRFIFN
jgi:hypothetical protein